MVVMDKTVRPEEVVLRGAVFVVLVVDHHVSGILLGNSLEARLETQLICVTPSLGPQVVDAHLFLGFGHVFPVTRLHLCGATSKDLSDKAGFLGLFSHVRLIGCWNFWLLSSLLLGTSFVQFFIHNFVVVFWVGGIHLHRHPRVPVSPAFLVLLVGLLFADGPESSLFKF